MEKNIKKLILTRGIPGSGKSSWAKSYVLEDPEHRIRLNWDDMRNMMGQYWVPSREPVNKAMLFAGLNAAVYCNTPYDIVIDNMNLNPKDWKMYEDWINTYNKSSHAEETNTQYVLEFKDFFIPVEECIRRDSMRANPIGEKTIREIWRKYKHFIQTHEVEQYVNNLKEWDFSKPHCVVIDMDSTVCFNTQRRPWYGEGSTEAMINDIPNKGVIAIIQAMENAEIDVVVCTGRNEAQQKVTEEWLKKHHIHPKDFYMRKDGDCRKGVEVKKELISQILETYNVLSVFEDCEPIVQMYREMGLTVLQPNKGL